MKFWLEIISSYFYLSCHICIKFVSLSFSELFFLAAYGTQQREAIKNSINEAADRDDIQMLTRPVAAAVILNNQRNLNSQTSRENSHLSSTSSNNSELFKVVFDITESKQ